MLIGRDAHGRAANAHRQLAAIDRRQHFGRLLSPAATEKGEQCAAPQHGWFGWWGHYTSCRS